MNNELCFCGSGKLHIDCHAHIYKDSLVAKLYKTQIMTENEIDKQSKDNKTFQYKNDCTECCLQCICISETEFVQILDYLINNWAKEDILQIIEISKKQWYFLENEYPEYAEKIKDSILLNDLLQMDKIRLPFPCIFLDKNNFCTIYKIRPLLCRICRAENINENGCSIIPNTNNANLIKKIYCGFIFFNYNNKIVIRRPEPIFYYFTLIFKDVEILNNMMEIDFFRNLIQLNEHEYIQKIDEYMKLKE